MIWLQDHGDIVPPRGSEFTSIKVNKNGDEEVAAFVTDNVDSDMLEHIFIVIHGRLRDGDHHWKALTNAVNQARRENFPSSDREMAVIAPQFFSTEYNSGQYTENQLAWGDLNAWQPGGKATHPAHTSLSSFDVLDGIIEKYSDAEKYPRLSNVTVVGHGGGGQLVQRYAAVGKDSPNQLHVRYVHGDASSCAYFTEDRPILKDGHISKASCEPYKTWRYGFDQFPGTGGSHKSPGEYFKQYTTRDVVSMVGYEDDNGDGDQSCMAQMQGGKKRRNRNFIWYRYINTLARTDADLKGFPGEFKDVPDWGHLVNGNSSLRLVVIANATHDVEELFEGNKGQSVLFNDSDLETDWGPDREKIVS